MFSEGPVSATGYAESPAVVLLFSTSGSWQTYRGPGTPVSTKINLRFFDVLFKEMVGLLKITYPSFVLPAHHILCDLPLEVIKIVLDNDVPMLRCMGDFVVPTTNLLLICFHTAPTPVV